ncbi:MAG: adenylate/guanylate cyclase domain-containing protein [Actinomycetota bacterium]
MSQQSDLTFGFVDLAGFTALTEAMGDEEAANVAERFNELARSVLDRDDHLVKSIGDAVMLASPTPAAGLMLAGRLLDVAEKEPNFPIARAGLHHGPAVARGDDYFGASVNLAARVAAQAFGGQVLATGPVAHEARSLGLEVVSLGSFELKNVGDEIELFEVHIGPRLPGGAIDPVCRMRVERDRAAGRLRFESADYWFCSLDCAGTFARNPVKFAKSGER